MISPMDINNLNSATPMRYPYQMPLHLPHQIGLNAASLQQNTDIQLTSLMVSGHFNHCHTINYPVTSVAVEPGTSLESSGNLNISFDHITRPASNIKFLPLTCDSVNFSASSSHEQPHSSIPNVHANIAGNIEPKENEDKSVHMSRGWLDKEQPCNMNSTIAFKSLGCQESKGKSMKRVRYIKNGCSNTCPKRCKQKISQVTREELFSGYWNLEDESRRKEFIVRHANKLPIMTCKEGSRRRFSVDWAFTVKGDSFSVCKLFFLDTLDITEETAYLAIKHSNFAPDSVLTILNNKCMVKKKKKPQWVETDLDGYTKKFKTHPSHGLKKNKIFELKPGCKDACRKSCQSKFTKEDRLSLFNFYHNLSNIRKQQNFILEHVRRLERKYVKSDKVTRRGCSIEWLLPLRGLQVPVCKTFFLHTIGVSEHAAYRIGLQNDIRPVERKQTPMKKHPYSWGFLKSKYIKTLLAKGRLKSLPQFSSKNFAGSGINNKNFMYMKNTETIDVKLSQEPFCVDKAKKPPVSSLKATFSATPLYKANDPCHEHESMSHNQGHAVPHINNSIPLSSFSQFAGDSELATSFSHPQSDTSQPSNNLTYSHHQQPGLGYDLTLTNKAKTTPGVSCQNKMKNDTQMFSLNSRQKNLEKLSQNQEAINEVSWKVTQKRKTLTKQLRKGCSETCRRKCNQVVSQAIREELFSEFWQLENDTYRREYILTTVNKVPKKSNRTTESRRGCTIEWSVPLNGALVIVCKKFFLDTFDISENFVKTVHDKIERNADSMADMRGKHGKRSVVFAKEEKEMEKFIKTLAIYKAVRCVRCNTDFPRWCLESSLSLNQLYKEYANVRKQQGVKPACKTSFKSLCAKKFNLKYNSGMENICDLCSLASTVVNE